MKFLKIFLTVIVLLMTVIICSSKPALHKAFVITGENFKLERYTEKPSSSTKVQLTSQEYGSDREVKIEPSAFLTDETKKTVNNNVNISTEQVNVDTDIPLDILNAFDENKNDDKPIKKLSKREEIIAWNKWRSDLQNNIMMNSGVSGTIGTMYYFSFKVDKFRHISNIKAFTTNPLYQKEVNDKLIPSIKNTDYSQILEFPKGSARESTKFKGMFIIWDETSLATPGDFNDVERVHVYE